MSIGYPLGTLGYAWVPIGHAPWVNLFKNWIKKSLKVFRLSLPVKNDYYEKSTLTDKKYPMKTTTQNWPANSDGSVLARGPSEI